MSFDPNTVTGACGCCGRAYCVITAEGGRCLECKGRIWRIPSEAWTSDSCDERNRRKAFAYTRFKELEKERDERAARVTSHEQETR